MSKKIEKETLDAIDMYLIDQYFLTPYAAWDDRDVQNLRVRAMRLFQVFISMGYIRGILEIGRGSDEHENTCSSGS